MKIFAWDDGKGPWGNSKPSGQKPSQGRRAAGPNQPDIEDVVRQAQDKMKNFMGGDNGGGSTKPLKLFALIAIGAWLMSGFYVVATDQEGVVLRFGKYVETTTSGLHYHMPYPIETVLKPQVTRENLLEIGFRSNSASQSNMFKNRFQQGTAAEVKVPQESLMLTGDENIVDLNFTIRWKIDDARDYLFNVQSVPSTIKNVAESVMREVIGQHPIDDVLTGQKDVIQTKAKILLQTVLDEYKAGVLINGVELQQVNPPQAVIDAFRDVQAAKADEERAVNEALGYSNDILPRARGQAAQVQQNAEAYKGAKIVQAEGQAKRFESQLKEYRKAKEITKTRLYIEAMEDILKGSQKVIMTGKSGQNIVPYLPLNELKKGAK